MPTAVAKRDAQDKGIGLRGIVCESWSMERQLASLGQAIRVTRAMNDEKSKEREDEEDVREGGMGGVGVAVA